MQSRDATDIERAIAEIWSEFLDVDAIDVNDDFFELGGDSLGLISVVMRIGERFGLPLDTGIVAEGATIASLARCIRRYESENSGPRAAAE